MKSKFQILFSIEVLHDFFSTGRWNEIKFIATPETETLLKENEFTTRQIGNELLILTKTDSAGKVYLSLDLYKRFSFILVLQSPGYLNFTNISISTVNPPVFHFHNLFGNEAGGKHFISKTIQNYNAAFSYFPGDFVKGPDNKIYESIAKNTGGGGSVVPNNTASSKEVWVQHGDTQFINVGDTKEIFLGIEYNLELTGSIYNYTTSVKKKEHTISIYAFGNESLQYDKEIFSSRVSFDTINNIVQVDMRNISSGKYRVRVNDENKFLYLFRGMDHQGLPIVVDIFNLPADNTQAFIDAGQKPKRTKFTIAFPARRVLWIYNTRTNAIDKIEDTDGEFSFKADGLKKFISQKPIPFSESARKTFLAKSGTLTITSPLPNPQADRLLEKKSEIYTTATFINY